MNESARLELPAQLTQVNEFGLVVTSPNQIPPGIIFTLSSSTLDHILGQPVRVRAVGNRQLSANEIETTLIFVALDSSQVRQLRKFALSTPTPRSA